MSVHVQVTGVVACHHEFGRGVVVDIGALMAEYAATNQDVVLFK